MSQEDNSTRVKRVSYRKRKSVWLSVAAFTVVSILLAIPEGIRYGIKNWYKDQGLESIRISDVDFNPFTGKLVIKKLRARRSGKSVLKLDRLTARVDWWPLWKKRIVLSHVSLRGLDVDARELKDGSFRVAGISLAAEGNKEAGKKKESDAWEFSLEALHISNSVISLRHRKLESRLYIGNLQLDSLTSWKPGVPAKIQFSGRVNKAPVSLSGSLKMFDPSRQAKLKFRLQGLELDVLDRLAGEDLQLKSGKLVFNGSLQVSLSKKNIPLYEYQGSIGVKELDLAQGSLRSRLSALEWKGKLFSSNGQAFVPGASGELRVDGMRVDDNASGLMLAKVQRLSLKEVVVSKPQDIRVAAASIEGVVVASEPATAKKGSTGKTIAAADKLTLSSTAVMNGNNVSVDKIRIDSARVDLQRLKNGKWAVIERLLKPAGKEKATAEKTQKPAGKTAAQEGKKPVIRIGEITVAGKSQFVFTDYSVKPVFKSRVAIESAGLANIDSSRPEEKLRISLKGKVGKFSKLSVDGSMQPFGKTPAADVNIHLQEYSMPQLSSYTAGLLGYDLSSGQMNIQSSVKISAGKIRIDNNLVMNNLKVKTVDEARMAKLKKTVSIPLETALNLLKDGNDNIKLKLPISGDVGNFRVGLGDIINIAIGNALKHAAVAYLKASLQPYGAALTIFNLAGKTINAVQLKPVMFTPGQAVLGAQADAYLVKVAKLMKKRSGMRIRLCGRATEADRRVVYAKFLKDQSARLKQAKEAEKKNIRKQVAVKTEEALVSLARTRAEVIKTSLASKHGIPTARLFVCQPEIDKDKAAKPRTELLI